MSINNGKNYPFEAIKNATDEEIKQMAEGNKNLFKLLSFCFKNNVETFSCCGDGKYMPYITLVLSRESKGYINSLIKNLGGYSNVFPTFDNFDLEKHDNHILITHDIKVYYDSNFNYSDEVKKLCVGFYFSRRITEEGFGQMLKCLKTEKREQDLEEIKEIRNQMMSNLLDDNDDYRAETNFKALNFILEH